ncbi:NAD(P)/FAD-dependent oxidoreductase [Polynucleobacter sp. MG-27-Goln-C1]|uniref:protoporphyrinogen/coproporphyrinogen oxidase n=1 Tax=Polynucleobacter sp. MG-27-Goln-C1 TaxID=1819726 RepID=UPI001C0D7403|nr:FAD-dependent oxidoreductase [Polynucleobacter sp. MG-27-Goln-C1]MBU3612856.1 FAD-dependent oxidoreductase [Polynucleobacter sp. MG-27-Goln-C1]
MDNEYTILGAGLAGLSCSYHIGHDLCHIFEAKNHAGGHAYTHEENKFYWDEGPHVSFTKHPYIKKLLTKSVSSGASKFQTTILNYFNGSLVPHPVQSNLRYVPEPLRTECLNSFMHQSAQKSVANPKDYADWLKEAFGTVFSVNFPWAYTKKYWTQAPSELDVDWIGNRVFKPSSDAVLNGYHGNQVIGAHYVDEVSYPNQGGFYSYASLLREGSDISFEHIVSKIDLKNKLLHFSNGKTHNYKKLISTIPLPQLIYLADAPSEVRDASKKLSCTSVLLINIEASSQLNVNFHWMYVYDENKMSTRLHCINKLSPNNTPADKIGIQVEVYESTFKPFNMSYEEITAKVCEEVLQMKLLDGINKATYKYIPYANVIFNKDRRANQEIVLDWLSKFGLLREADDLEPNEDWHSVASRKFSTGDLILAGRFGQWKYYWSDDCILRGLQISGKLSQSSVFKSEV